MLFAGANLFSFLIWEDRMITQFKISMIPAEVVIYSYTVSGNKKEKRTEIARPIPLKPRAPAATPRLFFSEGVREHHRLWPGKP